MPASAHFWGAEGLELQVEFGEVHAKEELLQMGGWDDGRDGVMCQNTGLIFLFQICEHVLPKIIKAEIRCHSWFHVPKHAMLRACGLGE